MAATYYNLNIGSTSLLLENIELVLDSKGLRTSTLFKDASNLVFTTPLTNKIIKFTVNSLNFRAYYGDAWTSGANITNQIIFSLQGDKSASISIVIDDAFFAIVVVHPTNAQNNITYVGVLDNGDVIIFGTTASPSTGNYNSCIAMNLTTNERILPLTYNFGFTDLNLNIYIYDLMWVNVTTKTLILNGSLPAKTIGIKATTADISNQLIIKQNYILTPSTMYIANYGLIFKNSLIIQF